jgi:hypothetical protein
MTRSASGDEQAAEDSLGLRFNIFARRRVLHTQRYWLRARARLERDALPPHKPVFIIGSPRSGTTLLFRLMRRHEAFWAPRGEGHVLWNAYQHPRHKGWTSDRVTKEDIKESEPHFLYSAIEKMTDGARFLDKTPRNALKLPYLMSLFPDASIILLRRSGLDTVSSLIEGWTVRHGVSYRLPEKLELNEYEGRLWSYVLPPGWQERKRTTFADIAALQYTTSYEIAIADLQTLEPPSYIEIQFEELLRAPAAVLTDAFDRLGLGMTEPVLEMARNLGAHPVQTNTPPRAEKWRDREDEIMRILPQISPVMKRLGYSTDVKA